MYILKASSYLNTQSTYTYLTWLIDQIGHFKWSDVYCADCFSRETHHQFKMIFKSADQMTRAKKIMKDVSFPLYNIEEVNE